MNNAAIYCRISRDAEGEGTGVARQEELCRELAARHGLTVVEVYTDNDIGASEKTDAKKVRHGFNKLVADTRAGLFQHIIAYSNSRLTRRIRELEDLIQLHDETRVEFRTVVSGDDDLSTSDGRMIARLKATVDAAESDRISERQKAAFRFKAMQGEPKITRQRAFGWEPDGITVREEEAARVRDAVEKIQRGSSITAIAREWERAGVLTAAGGSSWDWTTVRQVCIGWRSAGIRTYRREPLTDSAGELVRGTWEPLISLEDRALALAALEKRSRKKVREGRWMLTGLLWCGECAKPLYGQLSSGSRGIDTYACKSGDVSISALKLENVVQSALLSRMNTRMHEIAERVGLRDSAAPIEWHQAEELKQISTQISELTEAYKAQELPGTVFIPLVQELEAKRTELRKAREEFYASQALEESELTNSFEIWNKLGADVLLAPEIQYDAEGNELKQVDEKREEKLLLMKSEIERVIVKKGLRGRANRDFDNFLERLEFHWNDQI